MSLISAILANALAGRAGAIGLLLGALLLAGEYGDLGPRQVHARVSGADLGCLRAEVSSIADGPNLSRLIASNIRPSGKGIGKPACVYIDHPELNKTPGARVYLTANRNPGGVGDTLNNHTIGAWYDADVGLWAVANQDWKPMEINASFNVAFTSSAPLAAAHVTTAANTTGSVTYLDHPLANGNPYALIQASPSWNSSAGGTINNRVIGVWYDAWRGQWAIFNQDSAAMPLYTTFHLYVAKADSSTFVQRATADNTNGNTTWIDHPAANGRPKATLIVTPSWSPNSAINSHVTGVWYDAWRGQWAIFNQDSAAMPPGASFNILVLE